MEIKKVSDCTLKGVLKVWNQIFTGYIVPREMNETAFLHHFVHGAIALCIILY